MTDVAAADSRSVRRRAVRFLLPLLLAALLASLSFRAALVRGLWQPARVAGSSMAETLVGDHWQIVCRDCRYSYRCDADQPPSDLQTVCPNCGFTQSLDEPPAAPLRPGDQVRIDRWPAVRHRFAPTWRRGDLVAFTPHDEPDELAIKRIVGLPGETVELRDGDVWIDGQPWRKTWEQFLEVAIVVHDDRYRPPPASPVARRWRPDADATAWRDEQARYICDRSGEETHAAASSTADDARQWLRFTPLAGFGRAPATTAAAAASATEYAPIRDVDFYNADVSRTLHPVFDLTLAAAYRLSADADLLIRLDNGREQADLRLRPGQPLEVQSRTAASTFARATSAERLRADQWLRIAFGQFDRRLVVVVDGRTVCQCDWLADDGESASASNAAPRRGSPWSIGVARGRVEVERLKILRDLYYLPPRSPRQPTSRTLGRDEWFVLGDNPTTSVDSRDWPAGGVPTRNLYGLIWR